MAVVGSAEIIVRAITTKVKDDILRAFNNLAPDFKRAGEQLGGDWAEGFVNAVNDNVARNLGPVLNNPEFARDAQDAGTNAGGGFSEGFNRELGNVDFSGVTEGLNREMEGVDFGGLSDRASQAGPDIRRAGEEAGRGWSEGFGGSVQDNVGRNLGSILNDPNFVRDAQTAGNDVGGGFADGFNNSVLNINLGGILQALDGLAPSIQRAGEQAGAGWANGFINSVNDTITRNLGPILHNPQFAADADSAGGTAGAGFATGFNREVEGSIDLRGIAERAGRQMIDAAGDGLGGGGGGLDDTARREFGEAGDAGGKSFGDRFRAALKSSFTTSAIAASSAFTTTFAAANIGGVAIAGLVSSLSAAVSGLFAMASAASVALGSLGALAGGMGVLAQAAGTLKLAFMGVGAALKAGLKASTADTSSIQDGINSAADAVKSANAAIADARQNLARAQEDAARRIADARRNIQQAYEDAADASAAASRRVQEAERGVLTSERELLDVQRDLNIARQEAAESLQQLAFSAEDAALAEERAGLTLQDALAKLQEAQSLPPDDRARIEAELSYKEAELNYRQAKDRSNDLAKEQKKAAKAGIEGSDEVVAARGRIAEAENGVAEAVQNLQDARADEAQTAEDNAERIADARRGLADAELQNSRSLSDAREALAEAQDRQLEAQKKYNEALKEGSTASDNYNTALQNLSKPAREFVKYLISIKDAFDPLKTAAGEELFPRLQEAIEQILGGGLLETLQDNLRTTGALLGEAALGIADIFKAGARNRLGQVLEGNNEILAVFATQGEHGANTFSKMARLGLRLLAAVQPLTLRFANWIKSLVDSAEAATRSEDSMKRLTNWFNKAGNRAALLGRILKNAGGVLIGLGKAGDKSGKGLLQSLNRYLRGLNKFVNSDEGRDKLEHYFDGVAKNMRALGHLVRVIGRNFGALGDNQGIADFAEAIEPAVDNIGKMADNMTGAGGAFGEFLTKLSELALFFADTSGFEKFFDTLSWGLDRLKDAAEIVAAPIDAIFGEGSAKSALTWVAGFLAMARAVSLMGKIASTAFKILIGGPAGALRKIGTWPVLRSTKLGKFISGVKTEAAQADAALDRVAPTPGSLRAQGVKAGKDFILGMNEGLRASAGTLATVLTQTVNKAKPALRASAVGLGAPIITGINAGLRENPVGLGVTLGARVRAAADEVRLAAASLGAQIITGINIGLRESPVGLGPTIAARVRAASAEVKVAAQSLALDIIRGISIGVREGGAQVDAAARGLARSLIAAIKLALGIRSPSTVMANVGRETGTGFVLGIEAKTGQAAAAGRELGLAAAKGAASVPVTPNVAPGKGAATGGAVAAGATATKAAPVPVVATPRIPRVAVPPTAAVGRFGKVAAGASKGVSSLGKGLGFLSMGLIGVSAPIAAAIAAFVALVIGLKKLYENSPEFKKFVDNIVEKFKELGDWIKDILTRYVLPALETFFGWVNDNLPKLGAFFGDAFGFIIEWGGKIFEFFKDHWPLLAGILFGPIGLAVGLIIKHWDDLRDAGKTLVKKIKDIAEGIKDKWHDLEKKMTDFIDGIRDRFKKFKDSAKALRDYVVDKVVDFMRERWEKFAGGIAKIVDYIKGRFENFKRNMGTVRDFFAEKLENLKDKFQSFQDKVNDVVEKIKDKWSDFRKKMGDLRDDIADKVQDVKDKFGEIRDAVGRAFSGLGGAAKDGINAFIGFLNDKLIANINKVTSKFGLEINPIQTLATGGPVRGVGTGRQDNVPILASNGEYMINERVTRKLGKHTFDYINKTGQLPPYGGWGLPHIDIGELIEAGGDIARSIAKDGIGKVLELAVKGVLGTMDNFGIKRGTFLNDFFYGIIEKLAEAVKSWGGTEGKTSTGNLRPPTSFPGGRVAEYDGPPGSWAYPLARKYPAYTFPGHNPSWSVDIGAPGGTPVRAASTGTLAWADLGGTSYGKYIVLQHAHGITTLYAHLSKILTNLAGKVVKTGQLIGYSGNTGGVRGANGGHHLHFEYRPSSSTIAAMRTKGVFLASGGVVKATDGGVNAVLAEAGQHERVEPLDRNGMSKRDRLLLEMIKSLIQNAQGGDQWNIHPAPGMNEIEFAKQVRREVVFHRRRGA